jgi:hypothetical protein
VKQLGNFLLFLLFLFFNHLQGGGDGVSNVSSLAVEPGCSFSFVFSEVHSVIEIRVAVNCETNRARTTFYLIKSC